MGLLRKAWDWIGHLDTVQTVIHTEFVRTVLFPSLLTGLTAVSGWLGGVPIMWIVMASTVVFGAVSLGVLCLSQYMERKSPLNKLKFIGTRIAADLSPATVPAQLFGNRRQRRAQSSKPVERVLAQNEIAAGVPRTLEKIQVGVAVRNDATFPISLFLEAADTEMDGEKPPRTSYPKPAVIILPGTAVNIQDERIDMDDRSCERMAGKMDMRIKYGLPGRERFELRFQANLDIVMTNFGFITETHTNWIH